MNNNLEEQIQLFIFPGYSINNECYHQLFVLGGEEICIDLKKETPRG